jgi:hypothetical protein
MAVPLVWRQAVSGRIGPNATGRASAGEVEEVKAAPAEAHVELRVWEKLAAFRLGPSWIATVLRVSLPCPRAPSVTVRSEAAARCLGLLVILWVRLLGRAG